MSEYLNYETKQLLVIYLQLISRKDGLDGRRLSRSLHQMLHQQDWSYSLALFIPTGGATLCIWDTPCRLWEDLSERVLLHEEGLTGLEESETELLLPQGLHTQLIWNDINRGWFGWQQDAFIEALISLT